MTARTPKERSMTDPVTAAGTAVVPSGSPVEGRTGVAGTSGHPETQGGAEGRTGLLPLLAGGERFGEEPADHVAAGAPFGFGDGVDLGDGLGVEADRVEVAGHGVDRSTVMHNVIQRDTVAV